MNFISVPCPQCDPSLSRLYHTTKTVMDCNIHLLSLSFSHLKSSVLHLLMQTMVQRAIKHEEELILNIGVKIATFVPIRYYIQLFNLYFKHY